MSYIGSSFFDYDYKFVDDKKFNADGSINKEGIVPGAYTTNYSAATKLEDVTSSVDAKWGYTDAQKAGAAMLGRSLFVTTSSGMTAHPSPQLISSTPLQLLP